VSNPKFLVLGDASEIAVSAEQAHYRPPQGDRPGGYLFEGDIKPKDLPALAKFEVDGERVILTHEDAPDWIGEDQCFVVSGVPFDQLTGGKAFRQFASTWEMVRGLRNPSLNLGSSGKTVIHGRIVQPFLDLALLLLGLPLVASRQDRNVFMAIGLGGLLATAFLVFALGCQSLGLGGMIPASLAAWLPLMVFIPVTVRLWHAM